MRLPWRKTPPHRCEIRTQWHVAVESTDGRVVYIGRARIVGADENGLHLEADGVVRDPITFDHSLLMVGETTVRGRTHPETVTALGGDVIHIDQHLRLACETEP